MKKNVSIVTRFLSDYLEIPHNEIKGNVTILNPIISPVYDDTKKKEVDVLVSYNNKVINIEMNLHNKKSSIIRNLEYLMTIMIGDVKSGKTYNENTMYLQINFNNFSISEDSSIREIFYIQSDNNNKLIENMRIDHIDMRKNRTECYNEIRPLLKWINLLTSKSIEELKENVGEMEMSKEEQDEVIDICTRFSKSALERLIYDPVEEQKKLFLSEIEFIKDEYLEKGIEKEKLVIAKSMINKNMSIEDILEITGLSIEDIKSIIEN